MTQAGYALLGLTALTAMLVGVLTFALLRIVAGARDARRHLRENSADALMMSAALQEAVSKLKAQEQVMSARADCASCDAGHKSHAIDSGLPQVHAFEAEPALAYFNGGDEHGILRPIDVGGRIPAIGQMLWLIPGHCDPTVNLHDHLIGVSGGLVTGKVARILRVDARGALT